LVKSPHSFFLNLCSTFYALFAFSSIILTNIRSEEDLYFFIPFQIPRVQK
jgi:hypothetical protein